jgi:glycerol-3-phosphate acyltransferase PlsX
MICHGGSSAKAIKNAIRFAHEYARKGVNQKMTEKMQDYITLNKQPREDMKDQSVC